MTEKAEAKDNESKSVDGPKRTARGSAGAKDDGKIGPAEDKAAAKHESSSDAKLECGQEKKEDAEEQAEPDTDREVLADIYNCCNGSGWKEKTNWMMAGMLDGWAGVTTGNSKSG